MSNITEEKEILTQKLSDQYSKSIINLEEYEQILEYINRIETRMEINIIEKIIQENDAENNGLAIVQNDEIILPKTNKRHLSLFSWRTINLKPTNGNGGIFTSLLGANRIIVDDLPKGRTIIKVNSIFGLTEIIVPQKVKVVNQAVPVFSGIFSPNEIENRNEEIPELYIVGKAVFGNITIRKIGEVINEEKKEKEFVEKYVEKTIQNIYDKISGKE